MEKEILPTVKSDVMVEDEFEDPPGFDYKISSDSFNQPSDVIVTEEYDLKGEDEDPSSIQDFDVIDNIGSGSFCRVKRIVSRRDGRVFALKIYNKLFLKKIAGTDPITEDIICLIDRVNDEIFNMMKMSHPNVCRLYEIYNKQDCQYFYIRIELGSLGIVSEFDTKKRTFTINDRLIDVYKSKKNMMDRGDIVQDVFRQMVDGLVHIHEKGIAHRDVKLDNLVVGEEPKVMWIDFNSSKEYSNEGETYKEYVGTLHYKPPETTYNYMKTDVWSLGICLYGLVFDRLPFDINPDTYADDIHYDNALMKKIVDEDVSYPSHIEDIDLLDILQSMLQKDPLTRIPLDSIRSHRYYTNI